MNKLTAERRAAILSALVEGSSVNSTARMTGCSQVTILRLLADAGSFSADYHDLTVRNIRSERVECDEVWSFVGCKARTKRNGGEGHGDAWIWVALDSDSKLVVSYLVGERNGAHAEALMLDLASRVVAKPQITTDSFAAYRYAVGMAFGAGVNYAVLHKSYGSPYKGDGRYSPPVCVGCDKDAALGNPDLERASTSYVERQNLSLRMGSRRFTRLTNGFSKKIENHAHAVALHYFHYNFVRKHATLKTTPAVAAGIATKPLTMLDLVAMIEREEALTGGRLTDYLPAAG